MSTKNLFMSQQLLVGESLKCAAHLVPNQKAVVYENQSITYYELLNRATHLAGWLQQQGMKQDEKVACIYKNNLAFIELYFASSLVGTVFVPLNYRLAQSEIQFILTNSDSKILFIEEEFLDIILSIKNELVNIEKIIVVGSDLKNIEGIITNYEEIYETPNLYQINENLQDDDAHVIVYTSGTTGKSKGAVLTHKNLYINGMNKMYENKQRKDRHHSFIKRHCLV